MNLLDLVEKETDILSFTSLGGHRPAMSSTNEGRSGSRSGKISEIKENVDDGGSRKHMSEKGSKKKGGKHTSSKVEQSENDSDIQETVPIRAQKNQRKSKDTSSIEAKGSSTVKEASLNGPSDEWVVGKVLAVAPDLGELGGLSPKGSNDQHTILSTLSSHLRPMLLESLERKRSTMLQENAKRSRQLLDNLQKHLDEAFLDLQLYEKALDLFEDEPSICVILHEHLLKTLAAPLVDKLIQNLVIDNKLKDGIKIEHSEDVDSAQLASGSNASLAKSLPCSLSVKAQAVVEALEGKHVDTFMDALKALVEESGLLLKKLDKKLEKTLLHSYEKDFTSQVSSETDPVLLLPKIVALLYLQVYNKALQAPARAISAAVSHLKEEDCTADRILSKKEYLESKMPELKGVVLKNTDSGA